MSTNFLDHYLALGWRIIPVERNAKRPLLENWQGRAALSADELRAFEPCNYGVITGEVSGNLVDIDLDDAIALKLAPQFLPQTGCRFGRNSKPNSHWLYQVDDGPGPYDTFSLPGGPVEYRSDRHQTVVPPSIHPSGEGVRFDSDGLPARATRKELMACVRKLAAGALIAHHWRDGARHNIVLPLAGYLAWLGWSESDVTHFIGAICSVTHDEEADGRLNDVKTTFKRALQNKANSGLATLRSVLGEGATDKLREWLGSYGTAETTIVPFARLAVGHEGTDAFRAQQFADCVASHLRYVTEQDRWIRWNGGKWNDVAELEVLELARQFAMGQFETLGSAPPANFQATMRALLAGAQRRGIEATVALARGQLGLSVERLDADPLVIGCENGWVDLATGKGHPADPNMFVSKSVRAKFNPDARCDTFLGFLDRIFASDAQLIAYLQRVAGYLLTGDTSEQAFFIAHGTGANGKSTLFNVLAHVWGNYSANLQASALANSRDDGGAATPELAGLCGRRFAQTVETRKRQKFNDGLIKQVTGGERLTARFLNCNPFTFQPCFKLVMATNFKPEFSGSDSALFRRVHLIPFEVTIPEKERDPRLFEKLKLEADGILRWAVEGCLQWQDLGLNPPDKVKAATKQYREEMDDTQSFIDARVSVGLDDRFDRPALHEIFLEWAKTEGVEPMSQKAFNSELKHKGFREAPGKSKGRKWLGVSLKPSAEPTDEPVA